MPCGGSELPYLHRATPDLHRLRLKHCLRLGHERVGGGGHLRHYVLKVRLWILSLVRWLISVRSCLHWRVPLARVVDVGVLERHAIVVGHIVHMSTVCPICASLGV